MNRTNLLRDVKLFHWPWLDLIMVFKLSLSFLVILLIVSAVNFAWMTVSKIHFENLAKINRVLESKVADYEKNYEFISEKNFTKTKTSFVLDFLTFFAKKTPDGVWLTGFSLSKLNGDSNITLQGRAYRPERIAELLNLYDETSFFGEKELKVIEEIRGKDNLIDFILSTDEQSMRNLQK